MDDRGTTARMRLAVALSAWIGSTVLALVACTGALAAVTGSFGGAGTEAGKFSTPAGVAVNDSSGDVYVVDSGNDRIQQFTASGAFVRAWGAGVVASGEDAATGTDEVQTVTVNATSGSFTLTFSGQTTSAVAYDAPAKEGEGAGSVEAALDALSTIGGAGGSVSVGYGPGNAAGSSQYEVTFEGSLGSSSVAAMTANGAGLGVPGGATLQCTSTGTVASYQWLANGKPIAGASSSAYTVSDEESGKTIQCEVVNSETFSAKTVSAAQASVPAIVASPFPATTPPTPPASIAAPSGTVAAGDTLTCAPGTWTGAETLSYQWYREGAPMAGAQSSTYTLTSENVAKGAVYQCAVTGQNAAGAITLLSANKSGPGLVFAPTAKASLASPVVVGVSTGGEPAFETCNADPPSDDVCRAGVPAGSAGALNNPQGIAVDQSSGDLYVTVQGNHRVDEYGPEGRFLAAFGWGVLNGASEPQTCTSTCRVGLSGTGIGEFGASAGYPAIDPANGNLLVAEPAARRVQEFSTGGALGLLFGWNAVFTGPDNLGAEAFEVCVPADGDACTAGALTVGTHTGQFGSESPKRVTANAAGDVYAIDNGNYRVEEFAPAPGQVPSLTPELFAPAQLTGTSAATAPSNVLVDPVAKENVLVVKPNGAGESEVLEFNEDGAYELGAHGAGEGLPAINGAAIEPTASKLYLSSSTGNVVDIYSFTPTLLPPPVVKVLPPSEVTATTATLNGEVDPEGYPAEYHFEYSSDGTHWTSTPEGSAGSGNASAPVTAHITGLTPNTLYIVRLVATGPGGTSAQSETTFATAGAPPTIARTYGAATGTSTATLYGEIDPNNSATSYRFQYVSEAEYDESGFANAAEAPAAGRPIGAGSQAVPVSEAVAGLEPATTYELRLLATNSSAGTANGQTTTFTTASLAEAPGSCPNEATRADDASTVLPACRALEMVTPPYKDGVGPGGAIEARVFASAQAGGAQVLLNSHGVYAGAAGNEFPPEGIQYDFLRGPDGWQTTALEPPANVYPAVALAAVAPSAEEGVPPASLWEARTAAQGVNAVSFYLREPDGAFVEVGPELPPGATSGAPTSAEPAPDAKVVEYVGGSQDLSQVLFSIQVTPATSKYLWPGDGTTPAQPAHFSLYEYAGLDSGMPTLVGVNNEGAQLTTEGDEPGGSATVRNAVSALGSTVFFTAAHRTLFARVGAVPSSAATVNVAGSAECEGSDLCNVTEPVSYQGASEDGSKVFFTTTQPLLAGDSDTSENLYECELPGDAGGTLSAEPGAVNRCPSLKEISAPEAAGEAKVLGVSAISADGSHVYYVAEGVISSAANAQGQTAQAGRDNLYVYEPDPSSPGQYRTAFIGALAPGDADEYSYFGRQVGMWTVASSAAQSTPDGESLVFTSEAQLTPNATSGSRQVFDYAAATGALTMLSAGAGDDAATIPVQYYRGAEASGAPAATTQTAQNLGAVSADGKYLVFTSEAVLAEGAIAGNQNMYEYWEGRLALLYDGQQPPDGGASPVLEGIDSSGNDVFFTTGAQLLPADTDTAFDIYDARVDGGFPASPATPGCEGEACLGPITAPLTPVTIGSTSPPTVGNLSTPPEAAPAEEKPTGKVKIAKVAVHGKKVVLTVKAPAKGKLTATGAGLRRASKNAAGKGNVKLKLKLTVAGAKKLKRKGFLKLKVKVAFKPSAGTSSSATAKVTLHG